MKIDGTRAHDRATELVLAYYAAFNRGDWAGMQALLADDVVTTSTRARAKPASPHSPRSSNGWRAATANNCATWW